MNKIRTRYAPSPTGYLHIGGARTALFCYLYAKHFKGDFVFRLEDTDVKRNVADGERSQLENLAWLGIVPDESPLKPNKACGKYRQSEKLDRYQEIADELVKRGLAYKAYDTSEELEAQHEESNKKGIASFRYDRNWLKISEAEKTKREKAKAYSIRLSMPKDVTYEWEDLVRGNISFNSNDIGDWVIQKSDGYPTYNFAVVVDDHDMKISHVLRGEEHITNTPKQLAIYQALNWEAPYFGHLTVITNMEGKKLSKRDTSLKQFIEDYRNEGYHPEGVFNFLSLLGWSSPDTVEVMKKAEIIEKFDPARLSKSPSKFDIKKMQWFSKQYIKEEPTSKLLKELNLKATKWNKLFVDTFKESVFTTSQLIEDMQPYLKPTNKKLVVEAENHDVILTFKDLLNKNTFTIENIQAAIDQTKEITGKKGKNLFMSIRLATTYIEHGPELAKAIYLYGEDLIKERLAKWK
ncbi:glutamate--tRNA ligase [Mycoplasmopsis fermentans]|uniref:glutamate--tRNA ligase n=1 Tax=Mycoplasmopsis fermentans TaxID=2115 RepID=UPI000F03894B|nr:glutamate--tRNA ligase [Mycoplasmopsis fermentans]RMX35144.1 glutamate--tRNA ligase [Mycoplasmopsis fermentans MF-I1]RMX35199.1 glutamate--tRNA ligase [Mycoplasmopsis fermentans MF-I2]